MCRSNNNATHHGLRMCVVAKIRRHYSWFDTYKWTYTATAYLACSPGPCSQILGWVRVAHLLLFACTYYFAFLSCVSYFLVWSLSLEYILQWDLGSLGTATAYRLLLNSIIDRHIHNLQVHLYQLIQNSSSAISIGDSYCRQTNKTNVTYSIHNPQ